MGNIVAIVGRPNVGKSTFFNRLTESRHAIVDELSGVTRDRHYGQSSWGGKDFSVIDTGGYVKGSDDVFEGEIRKQVQLAIEEANVILFVVDVTTGVTDLDESVADLLRRSGKKVFLAANKVDNSERLNEIAEFYSLGLGEVFPLSSINGGGSGELLDAMAKEMSDEPDEDDGDDLPRFAVVGRPNVGKSSLVNALLGKERNIVTPVAGTTRDAIGTHYNAFGFDFKLIDTAGVRKKGKVNEDLEFYSVMRSIRAIENCDVCLLMIDAQEGVQAQDLNILHIAQKNRKGIVIMINKWDLIDKETNTAKMYEEKIRGKMAPFVDVPILFVSVLEKQRIFKALETAVEVYENRTQKFSTSELNNVMLPLIEANAPPAVKGKYVKIKYVTQLPTHAPTFAFFCNLPQYVKEPYKRYLENKLRENFNLTGVPIKIFIRKK